jgi:DNA-binding NarL/FixJ family response regulator
MTSVAAPATVVVAMGCRVYREALAAALAGEIAVVATEGDLERAAGTITELDPDVVLVESGLPGGGHELCATLKASGTTPRVLVLGSSRSEEDLVAAVHAGADGYLDEEAGTAQLVAALTRVASGEASIPGDMLGGLLRSLIRQRREEDEAMERIQLLSRREREILALLAEGLDNEAIAEHLVISTHTARTHVQNILRKLEVHSRLEAAALASTSRFLDRLGTEP